MRSHNIAYTPQKYPFRTLSWAIRGLSSSIMLEMRTINKKTDAKSAWARRLKERRHVNVAAVALAAKHARIAWAILAHGADYRPAGPELAAA